MIFLTQQIKGAGRGHHLGFPTINLSIPEDLVLDEGIYAAWVVIDNRTYKGALHYGAIPTFGLTDKTMEVHLIDVTDDTAPDTDTSSIEIDTVERLRDVKKFPDAESLSIQMHQDVKNVMSILQ